VRGSGTGERTARRAAAGAPRGSLGLVRRPLPPGSQKPWLRPSFPASFAPASPAHCRIRSSCSGRIGEKGSRRSPRRAGSRRCWGRRPAGGLGGREGGAANPGRYRHLLSQFTFTHARAHARTRTRTCTRTHPQMQACKHTHARARKHTHKHAQTHAQTHKHTNTHTHTHKPTQTHKHTNTQTHTRTHLHHELDRRAHGQPVERRRRIGGRVLHAEVAARLRVVCGHHVAARRRRAGRRLPVQLRWGAGRLGSARAGPLGARGTRRLGAGRPELACPAGAPHAARPPGAAAQAGRGGPRQGRVWELGAPGAALPTTAQGRGARTWTWLPEI
jgi:hypothetical protein